MFLNKFNPTKITKDAHVEKLIKTCISYLPSKKKTKIQISNCLRNETVTIDQSLRYSFTNHIEKSKKEFFKNFNIDYYIKKKKTFRTVMSLAYPPHCNSDFVLEEYWKGYDRNQIDNIKEYVKNTGTYQIYVLTFGQYKFFTITKKNKLTNIGLIKGAFLLKFYHITGKTAYVHFPFTNENETSISKSFLTTASSILATVASTYFYFQNAFIVGGIVLFSVCSLWINDAINPRRHPVLNILQAIIYGVIFFFIK